MASGVKLQSELPVGLCGPRRKFLKQSSIVLTAGIASFSQVSLARAQPITRPSLIGRNEVVLFQGDSITDAGWNRADAALANQQSALGSGYAWLAAAELLVDRPADGLKFFNRGVSGNKVLQLADRWQQDCLELKPNLLSILVGVNDYWHTLSSGYQGTVELYERDYRPLLERTRKALPHVKLLICEPFVFRCGAVSEQWFPEFDRYRDAAKRVAETFKTTFLPFQSIFDEAAKYAPPAYWAADGVHPTPAGASLMAHNWLKAAGAP